jgi:hypothetical protein
MYAFSCTLNIQFSLKTVFVSPVTKPLANDLQESEIGSFLANTEIKERTVSYRSRENKRIP